jgi:hypothetical protein
VVTNCFGTPWGDLEKLFVGSLLPLLEIVIPAAHLTMHALFLKQEKRKRDLKLLSIFTAPTPPGISTQHTTPGRFRSAAILRQ